MTLNIEPDLPVEYVPLPVIPMAIEPVTLTGSLVELVPMTQAHLDELAALGAEESIWTYSNHDYNTREKMAAYIDQCVVDQAQRVALPFVIKDRSSEKLAGSTRLLNLDRADYRLEIGSTWLHPRWQRTGVNTEAKYLLLTHAFETLKALRVQLKTDVLNVKSRAAMERLGAQFEGIFRYYNIRYDGRIRHSAYYAFVRPDWPATKAHIEGLMRR